MNSSTIQHTRYLLFGVAVAIHSEVPSVLSALDARLSAFRVAEFGRTDIDIVVEYIGCDTQTPDSFRLAQCRPIYDVPGGVAVYDDASQQFFIDDGHNVRLHADVPNGTINICVATDDSISCRAASHVLFTLPLIEVLKRFGRYSLHAACLSIGEKGLLLSGASGSGKSTLTLALLRSGFGFLGDDMVFFTENHDGVEALAFPDQIDITPATVQFFPELAHLLPAKLPPGWPKLQLQPEQVFGVVPSARCRPEVLVFPRVGGSTVSTLTPVDAFDALLEVAPNVLLTDPVLSQAHFDVLGAVVRQCACYRLETGTNLDAAARMLRKLVA